MLAPVPILMFEGGKGEFDFMEVIVHRGTRQIGGSVTEVRTASTRILIDFGADLPSEDGTWR
jgi:mRNA degradation ribonuclease J1/J2